MKKPASFKSLVLFIMLCIPFIGIAAQQKVSVYVTNATLKQVFGVIEKQTSYRFSYKSDIIDNRKDITIKKTAVPVNLSWFPRNAIPVPLCSSTSSREKNRK